VLIQIKLVGNFSFGSSRIKFDFLDGLREADLLNYKKNLFDSNLSKLKYLKD
jgi:hypothetical protein